MAEVKWGRSFLGGEIVEFMYAGTWTRAQVACHDDRGRPQVWHTIGSAKYLDTVRRRSDIRRHEERPSAV